ncbi:gfo/Idh/MocA family oxidoreductase [Zobellia amurskyensis]|uniref:Gfo/Idh/MocA family oxidoreductase n=1 Tax=Zobellia amurskyensis TaxID=248905 RepID=A0A7X3D2Q7_9FLAO|nr:Gfo/Idh/MocA family oxidoreductase [Zobellia amurskyensis]MUH36726.1 gfo/Idh/MocA family oxidoreductase [Zobellia amurskyensis]
MSHIGVGIIGTGSIVHTYVKCLSEMEGVRIVGLCTKSKDRVEQVKAEFGLPVYSDYDSFLALPEIDLVCICNESGKHSEAIQAAAMARKHILSEKPLEVTTEKIDGLIALCKEQKVLLGCVLQNRCSTDYRRVEEAVKSGKLGKLLMGNASINWYRSEAYYSKSNWRGTIKLDGGAAFINQGIHTVDLLMNLMGAAASVFANVQTRVHKIEGEDVGAVLVNYENGAIGTITAGTALFPGYPERVEVYGEKGSIIMEGGKIIAWNIKGEDSPELTSEEQGSGAADPTAIGHQNHKIVLQDMVEAIRNNRKSMVDGAEARKSVALINAIYESSRTNKLVRL